MAISNSYSWTSSQLDQPDFIPGPSRQLNVGPVTLPLPASRILRIVLGIALCIGGFLGFLPILGFWMLPLGLVVLSMDLALARRLRRRIDVRWGRRKKNKNAG